MGPNHTCEVIYDRCDRKRQRFKITKQERVSYIFIMQIILLQ